MSEQEQFMAQIIEEIPTLTEALRYSVRLSGLSDKLVYLELGIDPSKWSRIMSGQVDFPHEKFIQFMAITRTDIPLQWLAKKRGYELKVSQITLKEQLQKEKMEKEELQKKLDAIIEVLKQAGIST